MEKKSYKITFDLKEGYSDNGREHPLSFAEEVIRKWIEIRLRQDEPIVTGLLQSGSLFYPSVGEDNRHAVTISHSAIFTGELSSQQDMARDDAEVKQTLESLACVIKQQLKQVSVFITYLDEHWCV